MFKGNKEQKQYLNLSRYAKIIIDYDCYAFSQTVNKKRKLGDLLNDIIDRYMETANASISLRIEEERKRLLEMVDEHPNKETIDLIEKIVSQYEKDLIKQATSYPRDKEQKYFRLDNNNFNRIFNTNYCRESEYYNNKGNNYIKAIIEEYVRLPFHKRESILFQDTIAYLENVIKRKALLKVKTAGMVFKVRPYKIDLDEQHRYHYLIGKSTLYLKQRELKELKEKGGMPPEEMIASFRISRLIIDKNQKIINKSGDISSNEAIEIEKRIEKAGVMFLLESPEKIIIKLTDEGLEKYKIRLEQRPMIEKYESRNTFIVKATRQQASNYFFDFDGDVEIISPPHLRKAFYERYKSAANKYE